MKQLHLVLFQFRFFSPHRHLLKMSLYNPHSRVFTGVSSVTTAVTSKNKSVGKAGLVFIGNNRWDLLYSKWITGKYVFQVRGSTSVQEKLQWLLMKLKPEKVFSFYMLIQISQCMFYMQLNYRDLIKLIERNVQIRRTIMKINLISPKFSFWTRIKSTVIFPLLFFFFFYSKLKNELNSSCLAKGHFKKQRAEKDYGIFFDQLFQHPISPSCSQEVNCWYETDNYLIRFVLLVHTGKLYRSSAAQLFLQLYIQQRDTATLFKPIHA